MKKFIFAALIIFALGVYMEASANFAPLWDSPEHRNPNPTVRLTNHQVRNALENFHRQNWHLTTNPFPHDWVIRNWTENDENMSQAFFQTLFESAAGDNFFQAMPFNLSFFELVLSRHRHYFAIAPDGYDGYFGFYQHATRTMFTSMHDPNTFGWMEYSLQAQRYFAGTALHEVAHAFGLGESLAHLWSEELRGVNAAEWRGIWYRDSGFDRALLNAAGAVEFWRAAFSSNHAYGALWNRHMLHIASFNDMQLARAAASEIARNENLAANFRRFANISGTTYVNEMTIPAHWADHGRYVDNGVRNANGEWVENWIWVEGWVWVNAYVARNQHVDTLQYLLQAIPANVNHARASEIIHLLANFARANNISATPAFFDHFIISHLTFNDWFFPSQQNIEAINRHGLNVVTSAIISAEANIPGVTGNPIAFREFAGQNVGLISMRAFAYLIGSNPETEILPNYPTVGFHSIIGRDTQGRTIRLTVSSGSTMVNVYINEVRQPQRDLATWAGQGSGIPAGQLHTVNIGGNLFLPLRAVANIFGYSVEMADEGAVRFFVR